MEDIGKTLIKNDDLSTRSTNLHSSFDPITSTPPLGSTDHKFITKPFQGEITLDEPLRVTIMRDLKMIYNRAAQLLDIRPNAHHEPDQSWDLWGPFLICLFLSSIMTITETDRIALIFSSVFLINVIGSVVITVNSRLLGCNLSFLQILCIIGYCCAPMIIPAIVHCFKLRFYTMMVSGICCAWSIKCCLTPIGQRLEKEKRSLANYPIYLFFIFLYWVILLL